LIDGRLTVESNPGKGARLEVSVLLPREPDHG
jgi:signal transduction histidine kinase